MNATIPVAACVTAPAVGGIAVVQVAGDAGVAIVSAHLRKKDRAVDLSSVAADRLMYCQVVDGDDVVDDAVVCVRRSSAGAVIDVNLHGGPRIVQRVLMMLQRAGVQIVEPTELPGEAWHCPSQLHAEAMPLLCRAPTRRVAIWLAGLPDALTARLRTIVDRLRAGEHDAALADLDALLAAAERARPLLEGIRVVLVGPPNCGKSTLANAVARREQAIVSDIPGTTRDWTEHAAAIDGVPLTVVDTAGIRETTDPIEAEAIRRAFDQCRNADVVVAIADAAGKPDGGKLHAVTTTSHTTGKPLVRVINKCDLLRTDSHAEADAATSTLYVSALTGEGIDRLRTALLAAAGFEPHATPDVCPFTARQVRALASARSAIANPPHDRPAAAASTLENLLFSSAAAGTNPHPQV